MIKLKKWIRPSTVLSLCIFMAIVTRISILNINASAEKSYKSKILLTEFARYLNNLNSLEWQSIAKQQLDNELNDEISEARKSAYIFLKKIDDNEKNKQATKKIFDLYNKYIKLLREELRLINEHKIKQATELDIQQVDPTFLMLNNEINSLSNFYENQKQKAIEVSNIEITIVLFLGSGIIGGLFLIYNRFVFNKNQELEKTLNKLKETQSQLIQTEKMASLGQMVAGIAHEINNPISFIHSNIEYIKDYTRDLLKIVYLYQQEYPESTTEIKKAIKEIDLDFVSEDLTKILWSINNGSERIRDIVLSLRNFSRLGEAAIKEVDLHEGIESTLLILNHKFNNEIEIVKHYRDLPRVNCYPGLLNQVFMNILMNAGDALLSEKLLINKQIIILTEKLEENQVNIKIRDNGPGILPENQPKIFDPFFTTKPVGKGTGLGLSICYQIIQKHNGTITVSSEVAKGTEFTITLPIK